MPGRPFQPSPPPLATRLPDPDTIHPDSVQDIDGGYVVLFCGLDVIGSNATSECKAPHLQISPLSPSPDPEPPLKRQTRTTGCGARVHTSARVARHWCGSVSGAGPDFIPLERAYFAPEAIKHLNLHEKNCGAGLGRDLALAALKRGDHVIATARSVTKLTDLKDKGADVLQLDVTSPLDELHVVAKNVAAIHGRIDVVVNNAVYYTYTHGLHGYTPNVAGKYTNTSLGPPNTHRDDTYILTQLRAAATAGLDKLEFYYEKAKGCQFSVIATRYILVGAIEESTPEETLQQFNTNVFGALNVTRALLPYMRAKKTGTVVFMGSVGGWRGVPNAGLYAATKYTLRGISESLHLEIAPLGLRSTCIDFGYFRTTFLDPAHRTPYVPRIDDYNEMSKRANDALLVAFLPSYDGKQPGDPAKGVEVVLDIVRGEGLAAGKAFPTSVALGSDCYKMIEAETEGVLARLEEWRAVSESTDF
ncbi:hypothetical protein K438DRAFT_1957485 [Mycena galopus ATCC 62051]|nr:hypothetical protein K438DRAFT_1957485 [Mycena galopus ATCC 62051]